MKQHQTHLFASLPQKGFFLYKYNIHYSVCFGTLICKCFITTSIYGYLENGIVRDMNACDTSLAFVKI